MYSLLIVMLCLTILIVWDKTYLKLDAYHKFGTYSGLTLCVLVGLHFFTDLTISGTQLLFMGSLIIPTVLVNFLSRKLVLAELVLLMCLFVLPINTDSILQTLTYFAFIGFALFWLIGQTRSEVNLEQAGILGLGLISTYGLIQVLYFTPGEKLTWTKLLEPLFLNDPMLAGSVFMMITVPMVSLVFFLNPTKHARVELSLAVIMLAAITSILAKIPAEVFLVYAPYANWTILSILAVGFVMARTPKDFRLIALVTLLVKISLEMLEKQHSPEIWMCFLVVFLVYDQLKDYRFGTTTQMLWLLLGSIQLGLSSYFFNDSWITNALLFIYQLTLLRELLKSVTTTVRRDPIRG